MKFDRVQSNDVYVVDIFGQYACFAMPSLKVDPITYDIITPSAARNILQKIYWKPQFDYFIQKIGIINPIKKINFMTNGLNFENSCKICQRCATLLVDPHYRIYFKIGVDKNVQNIGNEIKKHEEILFRRIRQGKCYERPFMGQSGMLAEVSLPNDKQPLNINIDFGMMWYDWIYDDDNKKAIGKMFVHAICKNGIVDFTNAERLIINM